MDHVKDSPRYRFASSIVPPIDTSTMDLAKDSSRNGFASSIVPPRDTSTMDLVKDSPRNGFASSSIIVFSGCPGRPVVLSPVVLSPSFCGSEGHVCGETVSEPV